MTLLIFSVKYASKKGRVENKRRKTSKMSIFVVEVHGVGHHLCVFVCVFQKVGNKNYFSLKMTNCPVSNIHGQARE